MPTRRDATPRWLRFQRGSTLLLFILSWFLFSGWTLRGCLKPEKPSQILNVTVDLSEITLSADEDTLRQGRRIYLQHCLQCHLPDGRGGVGASLVDDDWVHGNDLDTILRVISAGTSNGMPGWSGLLNEEELGAVTSYVYSINPHLEPPTDRTHTP